MDAVVAAAGWFVHIAIDKYLDRKLEQWASRAGLLDDFRRLKNQSSMARATLTVVVAGSEREHLSLPANDSLLVLVKELQLAVVDVDRVLGEMDFWRLTEFAGTSSTAGALRAVLRRSADLLVSPLNFRRASASTGGAPGSRGGRLGHGGAAVASPFAGPQLGEISGRAKSVSQRLEHAAGMVRKIVRLEQSVLTNRLLLRLQEVNQCRSCSSMRHPKIQRSREDDDDSTNNGVGPRTRVGVKRKRGRRSCTRPPAGCTIPEVMELVRRAGAEVGSDEHFVATQLFVRLEFREMFLTLQAPEHRIAWLRRMWDERKGGQ